MEPAKFLELLKKTGAGKPAVRAYSAFAASTVPETFLTVHYDGKFRAFPYTSFLLFEGDERTGAKIGLIHPKWPVIIHGRDLATLFEAIRARLAAHLYQFEATRYALPDPPAPVIFGFQFLAAAGAPRPVSARPAAA